MALDFVIDKQNFKKASIGNGKKLWANLILQGSGLARKQSDLNSHFCYQNNTSAWIPNDD